MKKILFSLLLIFGSVCALPAAVVLAKGGQTDYVIVPPEKADAADKLAVQELAAYLKRITAADFKVGQEGKKHLYIGRTAPGTEPLKYFERRITSSGEDIYLAGDGFQGNAFAVYDFLEKFLNCRFFTFRGVERVPKNYSPKWDKLDYSIIPSFPAPYIFGGGWTMNPEILDTFSRKARVYINRAGITVIGPTYFHAPCKLVPPGDKYKKQVGLWAPYKYSKNDAYFGSHPEYFAQNPEGKRVPDRQLCYSNPNLRELLNGKLEEIIQKEYKSGIAYMYCDLNDDNGFDGKTICHCKECMKKVEQYQSPAGPYWDYLLNLCKEYKTKHPNIVLVTLAYLSTEAPPSNVAEMPDNLLIYYCPLNKNYLKSFDHPSNALIIKRFKQWNALKAKIRIQLYPSIYPRYTSILPLCANLRQLAQNLRICKQYGVVQVDCEQGHPWHNVNAFNEVRQYMLAKLCNDITLDENKVIEEAMRGIYGKAAPMMIAYWQELEKLEAAEAVGLNWYGCQFGVFSYLNAANLLRWSKNFDKMEQLVAKDLRAWKAVQDARVNLDEAIMSVYFRLPKNNPAFNPYLAARRIRQYITRSFVELPQPRRPKKHEESHKKYVLDQRFANGVEYFAAVDSKAKPLPPKFRGKKVYRTLPTVLLSSQTSHIQYLTKQPDASLNWAMKSNIKDLKQLRFIILAMLEPSGERFFVRLKDPKTIPMTEMQKHLDQYYLYYAGRTRLWPQCNFSLFHLSAGANAPLGQFYNAASPDAEYELYVSVKRCKNGETWIGEIVLVEVPKTSETQKLIPVAAGG